MRILLIPLMWALCSCAFNQVKGVNEDVKLKVAKGLNEEKAIQIAKQFLAENAEWNIKGALLFEPFEQKYQDECNSDPVAKSYHRRYCNAGYTISYSRDRLCWGGARIIESCSSGTCTFDIGKYSEICE